MGRRGRKEPADPWQPRAADLPRARAFNLPGHPLSGLRENPVFRWLVQAQRRRQLPSIDDLNPMLLGLLVPLLPLLLIVVLARMITRLAFAAPARRGLLMHLPEPLLRDLVMTRLTLGDVVAAIWGFEARAGKFHAEGRWLKGLLAVLLAICLTDFIVLACPLLALVAARLMIRPAYPFHCFPKLLRVLRRQAAETQGRTRASSYLGVYAEAVLAAVFKGCGFLFLLLLWEGLIFMVLMATDSVLLIDMSSQLVSLIAGIAAAAFGVYIGAIAAADLESEHERILEDIYKYTDEIVQYWWQASPFDGSDH